MQESKSLPPSPPGQPILGHTSSFVRDPFGFVRSAVESTGDVFQFQLLGKDVTVLAHPSHIETALLDRETFAKLDDFQVAFGDALLSAEGEQWQRQRRAMEDFFSPVRIQDHAETMVEVAETRTDRWVPGETVRLDEELRSLALQNLFEVILGQSLASDEIDEVAEVANALNLWFKPTSWALPDWVPTPARYRFRRGSTALRERARELLDASDEQPSEDSLLATLSHLRADSDSGFDREEVLDQVVGMLFAGHETTALAMTYALHQIGSHPAVAERLQAEVDATVDGTPSLSDLQALTYLDRVVSETLRLYPPVHAIPRVTTDAVDVDGYRIPADEQVLLSVWSIHRDARFYDAPRSFDPDRWSDTSPRAKGYAFVPFGAGPRICIGRHFARLEMKATLAVVAQKYGLTAETDISVSPQMTTQPDGPVTAEISSRTVAGPES